MTGEEPGSERAAGTEGSPVEGGWPIGGARAFRWSRRQRRRRQLASGLIAYGVLGLMLLAVITGLSIGPLASLGAVAGQRSEVVGWLDTIDQAFDHVDQGFTDAGASLVSAATSARNAASLSQDLATSMSALRDASRVSILGSLPLGGVTDALDRVSARASDLSSSMTSLADSLDRDSNDFAVVRADTAALRDAVSGLRRSLAGLGSALAMPAGWLAALGLGLVVWLAVPALASLAAGVWLLRRGGASLQ